MRLEYLERGFDRSQAQAREAQIKSLPRAAKGALIRSAARLALLLLLAMPARAAQSFEKEFGVRVTSAAIQGASSALPPNRLYYIRASTDVYSATTVDGLPLVEEPGVRLSSLTVPAVDIVLSSITGLSVLPLSGGGFRMLYSVIGTTGAFRIYSATSADGLAWANDTGTAVNAGGTTFAGFPSVVKLASGDWRLYYIQNSIAGDQVANHQIFTALSTNQGRNWSAGSVAVAARAGEVSAVKLTSNLIRLYYTAPLTGGTSNTVVLSALSSDINGASFSIEPGIRLSTSPGALFSPFVTRSTDTFRWRLYYDYSPIGLSTGDAYSAVLNDPDPQGIDPSLVLRNQTAYSSTVTGEVFSTGVTALLRKGGEADIPGVSLTRVTDQTLTATFDTYGAANGSWDLVVTNANGQSTTLAGAVTVDFPGGSVVLTDNLMRPRQGTQTRADVVIYNPGRIVAKLYTVDGQMVATLFDAEVPEGNYTFNWNGRTSAGNAVASGLYLMRVTGPKLDVLNKIVVIK